jgi:hypothetical protein
MILRALVLAALACAAGCGGPGRIEYVSGQCLIDGAPATLAEVETRQAQVGERILSRQPWFAVVTVLVLVLAGMSHIEKLILLFSTRKSGAQGLGERLKLALERYRAHPLRYFAVVAATLGMLLLAAGMYLYLDVDKRATERALGMLQFCHLALRTADEEGVLDQQRSNLQAIQSTAGDIRALVDKLPPEEQRKAQQIVDQMNAALGKQGKLVGEYLQRTEESTRAVKEHTATVERGLSSVEAGVLGLKSLPAGLHDLSEAVHKLDGRLGGVDGKLGGLDGKLGAADGKLGALDARLGAFDAKLAALDARLAALDAKLGALDAHPAADASKPPAHSPAADAPKPPAHSPAADAPKPPAPHSPGADAPKAPAHSPAADGTIKAPANHAAAPSGATPPAVIAPSSTAQLHPDGGARLSAAPQH